MHRSQEVAPAPTPEATKSKPKKRLAWPDVAKGVSILGVVLLHICLEVPHGMETVLAGFNHILDPLRMGLFFLVSGLFSGKILRMTFGQMFCRRLWFFIVPYLFFTPIEVWIKRVQWATLNGAEMPGMLTYLGIIASSENMYWFLWALVSFNIFLWATRKLPRWLAMALTAFPLVLLPLCQYASALSHTLMFLPVFMAGVHFSTAIREFAADAAAPRRIVSSVALYVAGFGVYATWRYVAQFGIDPIVWPLFPPLEVRAEEMWLVVRTIGQSLMLPAAVLGAVALSKVPGVTRFLQWVGRNTLPIYLGHPIALTLVYTPMFVAAEGLDITPDSASIWTNTWAWMLVGAIASMLGSMAFWALGRVPVIGWVLKPPPIEPLRARWVNRKDETASERSKSGPVNEAGRA